MRRVKPFLSVHLLQGLAESLLVGALILIASAHLEGYVESFVFQAAMFFLCGACGMWAALRIRIPAGGWLRQTIWELVVGFGLSTVLLVGLRSLGSLYNWNAIWRLTGWEGGQSEFLLACTGLGYFLARGGIRLWLYWDKLRRRRMLWSLTHAHLTVVVFLAILTALASFLPLFRDSEAVDVVEQTHDPLIRFVIDFLVTFFPRLILTTIATALALAILLPPLAIFSFFVARRTTRRLESLTRTTAALRAGDYRARVPVDGEDEVARLQSDFNAMAEKLESTLADLKDERDTVARVLQSRRDLVANVSHELRTPVATLHAAVETTLQKWESAPPDEIRQRLGVMGNEIQRLSVLIDDLFTLSQAEVNNLPLTCVPTALAPLVRQVVDAFAPLAWNSGRVEVTADLPADLSPALVDANRLQQVLLNLLRNGIHHTPPGGIVAILACDEAEAVRIEIRDTGEGIDPDDLIHIWERFYRGKNAVSEGAGLGLALVKELVESMRGSVNVESTPGRGSCFTVRLREAS